MGISREELESLFAVSGSNNLTKDNGLGWGLVDLNVMMSYLGRLNPLQPPTNRNV